MVWAKHRRLLAAEDGVKEPALAAEDVKDGMGEASRPRFAACAGT